MHFELDTKQKQKLGEWVSKQMTALALEQEKHPESSKHVITDPDGKKHPYLGAIGGGLTYEFTPTSLGIVTKVIFCHGTPHEATIDLTEYNDW